MKESTNMSNISKIDKFIGLTIFIATTTLYLFTLEPSVSFWDCGEFLSAAYKLQIPHPPGAPLFLLLTKLISLLSFGDGQKAVILMNSLSAIVSGLVIAFMYWTMRMLFNEFLDYILKTTKKTLISSQIPLILASILGSLTFAFTDSFWFSAVETEVYALSMLFTTAVFWAILKWGKESNPLYKGRWILLIVFLMGLSIGVHLLNLLTIPALIMFYFYKREKLNLKKIVIYTALSMVILGVVLFMTPMLLKAISIFETIFVLKIGMPINSGLAIILLLIITSLIYGIYRTRKRGKILLCNILLLTTLFFFGYSSYLTVIIRSSANPVLNENRPDNVFSLLSYINREQYGSEPKFYGPMYSAPVTGFTHNFEYVRSGDSYKEIYRGTSNEYLDDFTSVFPRMWDSNPEMIPTYYRFTDVEKNRKKVINNKQYDFVTFKDNWAFFWNYQLKYMYLKYFAWNFIGRAGDVHHLELTDENPISGIEFIDKGFLAYSDKIPDNIKDNQTRNKYYMLPFILGLIGLIFMFYYNKRLFYILFLFFFMTGIAILLYLNPPPGQVNNPDYAFVGSFYIFAIWIGFAVLALTLVVNKIIKNSKISSIAVSILFLGVPIILFSQNFDDHNRSGRTFARDYSANSLKSCKQNAILFTLGDNDTYPLWYLQEVESFRQDIKIINRIFSGIDWCLNMIAMDNSAKDSLSGVNISITEDFYRSMIYSIPVKNTLPSIRIDDMFDLIYSQFNGVNLMDSKNRDKVYSVPSTKIVIPVDKEAFVKNGIVSKENAHLILDSMVLNINMQGISRSDLLMLDVIRKNFGKRPIYTISAQDYLSLGIVPYLELCGQTYHLVPITLTEKLLPFEIGGHILEPKGLADRLLNEFSYGRIGDPNTKSEYVAYRMLNQAATRRVFGRAANAMLELGDTLTAEKLVDRALELFPRKKVMYDFMLLPLLDSYYRMKRYDKGYALAKEMADFYIQNLAYYVSLVKNPILSESAKTGINDNLTYLDMTLGLTSSGGQNATWANEKGKIFMQYRNIAKQLGIVK